MQREYAVRQIAKREGYVLERRADGAYRLINARLNVVVYHLDGVQLEAIESFLDRPESRANSPKAQRLTGTARPAK
jgi:hypothetical protein